MAEETGYGVEFKLYRDDKGKLKKTKSGHYRFDMMVKREGKPLAYALGFRLDLKLRFILPITTTNPAYGGAPYTIASVAPGGHDWLVDLMATKIEAELEEERLLAG